MAAAVAYVVYAAIDGPPLRRAGSAARRTPATSEAATQTREAARQRMGRKERKKREEETAGEAIAAARRSTLPPLSLLGPDLLLLTGLPPVREVPRGGDRAPAAVRRKDRETVEGELRTRLYALVAMGGGAVMPPCKVEDEDEDEDEYVYDDSCGCADCSAARADARWRREEDEEEDEEEDASSPEVSRSTAGGSDAPSDDSFRWAVVDESMLSADGGDLSLLWEESEDEADEEPAALPGHNKVPVAQRLMSEVEQLMQQSSPVEGEDIRNCIL